MQGYQKTRSRILSAVRRIPNDKQKFKLKNREFNFKHMTYIIMSKDFYLFKRKISPDHQFRLQGCHQS